MCARYSIDATPNELVEFFGLVNEPPIPARQFNLAPTDDILIVRQTDAGREAELARWGLLPWWAKDKKEGVKAINARADGLWSKPTYRDASAKGSPAIPRTSNHDSHFSVSLMGTSLDHNEQRRERPWWFVSSTRSHPRS